MVYLDNAATGGRKPPQVISAVTHTLQNLCANPGRSGHSLSLKAAQTVYDTRMAVAEFFGAREDEVCFTSGCTASVNMALKGVLQKGDRVVISPLEHNAVLRPLNTLKSQGIEVAEGDFFYGDTERTVDSFCRQITANTKMVVCTHASNVTGEIFPINALGEECRRRGIIFMVDAAQTAGTIPINMEQDNIQILCAAPHKGLMAPMGVGILICRCHIPHPLIEGGTGSLSTNPFQPDELPDRLESGTPNLPGIAGLRRGIEFIKQRGMDRIYREELHTAQLGYRLLASVPNTKLLSPYPEHSLTCPIISFLIPGQISTDTAAKLNRMGIAVRGGLHCAPSAHKRLGTIETGAVRVSLSYFNTKEDMVRLYRSVKTIAK